MNTWECGECPQWWGVLVVGVRRKAVAKRKEIWCAKRSSAELAN